MKPWSRDCSSSRAKRRCPRAPSEFAESGQRELLIRRTLAADGGRSRAYVNGEMATVQTLARMGQSLVQVYGQHEHQTLLRSESHLQLLDRHAALDAMLEHYGAAYRATVEARARADELRERERTRAEQLELARFRIAELERAGLTPGEDEQLAAERTVLANAARLGAAAAEAEQMLSGESAAALDAVARAETRVGEAAAIDPKLKDALELISSARLGLEEAAHTLRRLRRADRGRPGAARRDRNADGRADPAQAQVWRHAAERARNAGALARRDRRARASLRLARRGRSASSATRSMICARTGAELSARRQSAAAELKRRMETELKTLGMRAPVFEARFAPLEKSESAFEHNRMTLGPGGADAIEFMLSPNLGQPPMAARADRVGRRALARDARAQAPGGAAPRRRDDDLRRGRRRRRRRGRPGRRTQAQGTRALSPGTMRHPSAAGRRLRRHVISWSKKRNAAARPAAA